MTHLFIPRQSGSPDTVEAHNEDELFEKQLDLGVGTLGWIHTHPTQDAFLSSVDMHTHFGYQALLPEAIAVVMAPRANPSCGVFRLTDVGMRDLQTCDVRGFHEHRSKDGPLFVPCEEKQALVMRGNPKFTVIDTR